MMISRDAATYGAPMRPINSPLQQSKLAMKDQKDAHKDRKQPAASHTSHDQLGIELALPLTILAFLAFAQFSPMLRIEIENVVDWLVKNEFYFWVLTAFILLLPLRMVAVMLGQRQAKEEQAELVADQGFTGGSKSVAGL